MAVPHIQIRDLQIVYDTPALDEPIVAVDHFDLEVHQGEFVAILGPSGCGKSTTLMALAGLVKPESGEMRINGKPVTGPGNDRAVVFQEFALFPWQTVEQNIRFAMELRRMPGGADPQSIRKHLQLVGLEHFAKVFPHQLSGGMRQRVAIARALAVDPEILLMDEPFGSLDAQMREIMGVELLRIWDETKKTVLLVTHSIDEAIYLADRVAIVTARPGRVKEIIPVELPRPRAFEVKDSPYFAQLRRKIWGVLEEEVRAAVGHSISAVPAGKD